MTNTGLRNFLLISACLTMTIGCSGESSDATQAITITPSTNVPQVSEETATTDPSEGSPTADKQEEEKQEEAEELASPLPTTPRPDWLGARTIPTNAEGQGVAVETPPELRNRRFATIDTLPPPAEPNGFDPTWVTLDQAPEVLARSTWTEGCPVPPEQLAYITVPFWGFDGWIHTGELIVHNDVAADIISVFKRLHEERFPIEEMRIITPADVDAPPIGDSNNSGSFVCRAITGGTSFSEHAKGLAIDINPFHNPYVKGDRVLPEQATAYTERSEDKPGTIGADSVVVQAFADIGWTWGGDWNSLKDYQHFSANGR